ncbi:hypothetical protein HPB50_008398 [Hyalomma asiaticum]|uniref:Uncharacterized protein n=1 Tax=Hyalomma asiaticum TaxID=266040 RepID=A0ACB7TEN2_HYAAI|nr:hypothetical protein HPB50_008398 [Hyalomma asiaticum]
MARRADDANSTPNIINALRSVEDYMEHYSKSSDELLFQGRLEEAGDSLARVEAPCPMATHR